MFFENKYFDEKRNAPISAIAFMLISLTALDVGLPGTFYIIIAFFGSIIIYETQNNFVAWIFWILILLFGLMTILLYRHSLIEKIKEANLMDYEMAQKILVVRDNFLANPPNLSKVSDHRAIEEDGWRPIRVDYHLDQTLKADITGTVNGTWFGLFVGSFKGEIKADMSGRAMPELFNESTFILFQKGSQTMRLISPSVKTCREISYRIFEELLGVYNKDSHSGRAIQALGWGKDIPWKKEAQTPATKLLDSWEINPSHIHDRLTASLDLPFEERPIVKIKGIPIKEGVILGCTIALNQEPPKILFPMEFIWDLSRRLSPIFGVELLSGKPIELLS